MQCQLVSYTCLEGRAAPALIRGLVALFRAGYPPVIVPDVPASAACKHDWTQHGETYHVPMSRHSKDLQIDVWEALGSSGKLWEVLGSSGKLWEFIDALFGSYKFFMAIPS